MVIVLDPQLDTFLCVLKAIKLATEKELLQNRFPEPFDLAQGHGMVGLASDMLDPVFFELFFKPGCATPVHILPAVIGQHLLGNTVFSGSTSKGLYNVFRCLAPIETKPGYIAGIIIDVAYEVGILTCQAECADIALPQLVWGRALKEARLGMVLFSLWFFLLYQLGFAERLVDSSRAGLQQKKPLQKIGYATNPENRVRFFHLYNFFFDCLVDAGLFRK